MSRVDVGAMFVVEFVGLPGSGKTTVCRRLQTVMTEEGIACSTAEDFVGWSAARTMLFKLLLVLRMPARTLQHWVAGIRFWLSLDCRGLDSLRRVLLAPVIASWADRFLKAESAKLALFDQAGVQGVWSIGVLARTYARDALVALLAASIEGRPRLYVCIGADPVGATRNVVSREGGTSRFDARSFRRIEVGLRQAEPLMAEIIAFLKKHGEDVLVLEATTDVEVKVGEIAQLLRRRLSAVEPTQCLRTVFHS